MFDDKDMDSIHDRVNKVFWKQIRSMWPVFLVYFAIIASMVGAGIWLLLYLLDTYVGKV